LVFVRRDASYGPCCPRRAGRALVAASQRCGLCLLGILRRAAQEEGAAGVSDGAPLTLDGPRVPARSGTATSLVVFLYGYGADGNDLIGLARYWADLLPHTAFVSPHAPEPCPDAPMGRQWFPLAR